MNGLLVRVAVDSATGGWNAPCRADGAFCYVPIPESAPAGPPFDRDYAEFAPFVTALGGVWPPHLTGPCHLDPDFSHLTYGDRGAKAKRLREFATPGSFVVFWAGLRWLDGPRPGTIVCSIIGLLHVVRVVPAAEVGVLDRHRNAHTRRAAPGPTEVVVIADPRESGRLVRHVPIGEHRSNAQRVYPHTLEAWGDLMRKSGERLKDGYIQQSGSPPLFADPERFLLWFRAQDTELVHANNVGYG